MAERDDSGDLSFNVVCDLLANQRRRYALECLSNHTQAMALTDLAEDVAVRENERSLAEIPKDEVRTIRTSLYHIHIPKLADAGAVDCDQDRDLLQVSEPGDLVERGLALAANGSEGR